MELDLSEYQTELNATTTHLFDQHACKHKESPKFFWETTAYVTGYIITAASIANEDIVDHRSYSQLKQL